MDKFYKFIYEYYRKEPDLRNRILESEDYHKTVKDIEYQKDKLRNLISLQVGQDKAVDIIENLDTLYSQLNDVFCYYDLINGFDLGVCTGVLSDFPHKDDFEKDLIDTLKIRNMN